MKPEILQAGVMYKTVAGKSSQISHPEEGMDKTSHQEFIETGASLAVRMSTGWYWANGPMIGKYVDGRKKASTEVSAEDLVFDEDEESPQLSLFD